MVSFHKNALPRSYVKKRGGEGGNPFKKIYLLIYLHAYGIKFCVLFNKREVVFYQSTKGRGRSPRPFVL
jgi:hypothetical protein